MMTPQKAKRAAKSNLPPNATRPERGSLTAPAFFCGVVLFCAASRPRMRFARFDHTGPIILDRAGRAEWHAPDHRGTWQQRTIKPSLDEKAPAGFRRHASEAPAQPVDLAKHSAYQRPTPPPAKGTGHAAFRRPRKSGQQIRQEPP